MQSNHNLQNLIDQFKTQRETLLKEAFDLKYQGLEFTPEDIQANKIFETLRAQETKQLGPQFHSQALNFREKVESSPFFALFDEMPKGSLHHIHVAFYLPSEWFAKNSLSPNIYIDNSGKIGVFEQTPAETWKNVLKLREEASDKDLFDKNFKENFHLTDEDRKNSNVWGPFQFKVGNRLAICYRPETWKEYILECCLYAIKEGFTNFQIRTYVPNFGKENDQFVLDDTEINIYKECEAEARKIEPAFSIGLIFSGFRVWELEKIQTLLKYARELKKRHGDLIIGYDLVGEEKQRDAIDFARVFLEHNLEAEAQGISLRPVLHGGETLDQDNFNVYDLYLHKSLRAGHAVNLFKHPSLYGKYKEEKICIEVNPISNQVLQYVADLRLHPAINYHNSGLRISLSSDDPGLFRTTTAWDFFAAGLSFEFSLLDFKKVIVNSIESASMGEEIQGRIMKDWQEKWNKFVKKIIENGNQ